MAGSVIFSATDPGAVGPGRFWVTPGGLIYVRNATNTGWRQLCVAPCASPGILNQECGDTTGLPVPHPSDTIPVTWVPLAGSLLVLILVSRGGQRVTSAGWTRVNPDTPVAGETYIGAIAKVSAGNENLGIPITLVEGSAGTGYFFVLYELAAPLGLANIHTPAQFGPAFVDVWPAPVPFGPSGIPGSGIFFTAFNVVIDDDAPNSEYVMTPEAQGYTMDCRDDGGHAPKALFLHQVGAGPDPRASFIAGGGPAILHAYAIGFSIG